MRGRAWRRHQERLRKRKAESILRMWYRDFDSMPSDKRHQLVGLLARTPKLFSCWICGHRRRSEGPTVQERRAGVSGSRVDWSLDYAPIHGSRREAMRPRSWPNRRTERKGRS